MVSVSRFGGPTWCASSPVIDQVKFLPGFTAGGTAHAEMVLHTASLNREAAAIEMPWLACMHFGTHRLTQLLAVEVA
jgi:hypothetical protein